MSYKIIIKQGNLVNESNAGLIVNASNTKLLLGNEHYAPILDLGYENFKEDED